MAEEESGFTFVDKRRTAAPAEATQAVPTAAEPVIDFRDASPDNGDASPDNGDASPDAADAAPTTYDLLGYCINLLSSQAWQKLGLLADPQTGQAKPDLTEAKVAIDAVGDLAARLEGAPVTAIPAELRRDLRTLVNDLRLNYVSQRGPSV